MSKETDELLQGSVIVVIGLPIVVAVISLPLALVWSVVMRSLWLWFVVPLGVPELTVQQFVGLWIVKTLVFASGSSVKDEYCDPFWKRYMHGFTSPLVWLAIGWFVHRVTT